MVADANLVLRPEGNIIAAKELIESTRDRLEDIQESFQRTPADMAQDNVNGTAVQDEFIKLDEEFWGLLQYCIVKIANQPTAGATGGADQARLAGLEFPIYDGDTSYRNWKAGFNTLIAYVYHEEVKICHLLGALKCDTKV